MEQKTIYLDSALLSGRMKSYRQRSSSRVVPRGQATHLRKSAVSDVWIPSDTTLHTSSPSLTNRTKITAPSLATKSNGSVHINSAKKSKDEQLVKLDFEASAQAWKTSHKPQSRLKSLLGLEKKQLSNYVMVGMACLIFLFGVAAVLHSFKVDKDLVATVQAEQEGSADHSEDEPTSDDLAAYQVAPGMPRYLSIEKFGVKSRVRHMGLDKEGKLDVPGNVFDVAWYNDSAKPGSPGGASVIDGHVSGPTKPGALKRLKGLVSGDTVSIEKGNGETISYKVVDVQVLPTDKVDMSKVMVPATPGTHGLNLISCTGSFNKSTEDYSHRVVVFTEKI